MVAFDNAYRLVNAARGVSACLEECAEEVGSGMYTELGPGKLSAKEALETFLIRQDTASSAGILVSGLDEALASLAALRDTEPVVLFHWAGADRVFTLLVLEANPTIIGCIRVFRKG